MCWWNTSLCCHFCTSWNRSTNSGHSCLAAFVLTLKVDCNLELDYYRKTYIFAWYPPKERRDLPLKGEEKYVERAHALQQSEFLSEGFRSFVLLAGSCLWWKRRRWPAALNRDGAGRCEHLTLPSSLMGTHCVLTFKFPRYLPPRLSRCFPHSCYLAVRAGDLTADLKHGGGAGVLFNDFPPSPISFS